MKGYQITHSATPPILDLIYRSPYGVSDSAPVYSHAVLDFAIQTQVDVVILAGVWSTYARDPQYQQTIEETIDAFTRSGVHVAIVLDVANQKTNVPHMLSLVARLRQDVKYLVDDNGLWRAERHGRAMYRDYDHLSIDGGLELRSMFENLFAEIWP